MQQQSPARIESPARIRSLTPRQTEILLLLAEGLSDEEIAARLFVSPRTVCFHLTNIYDELQVNSRISALVKVFQLTLRPEYQRTLRPHVDTSRPEEGQA